jgi:lysophospholipase L1-like esterase
MSGLPNADRRRRFRQRLRHVSAFALVLAAQFAVFEAALRTWGSSEAAPAFQGLFEGHPRTAYRLKPHARVRFTTAEFQTEIAINGLGVRDDEEIGPKRADEKRIVILGDSLVLSLQVPFSATFGELLEARLDADDPRARHRVINAGVQGYGPVQQTLLFDELAPQVEADLVLAVVFVGNDAEEAYQAAALLDGTRPAGGAAARETLQTELRRLVRRSMVLQVIRLRVNTVLTRMGFTLAPPEAPHQTYAAHPAPRIAEGLAVTRRAVERIAETAARDGGRTAVVLMPARFQLDDDDYGRLRHAVASAGGELVRDAATARFDETFAATPLPRLDLLPALRAAPPGPALFFQRNVHLTPRGHEVVAAALARFIVEHELLAPPAPGSR